MNLIATIDGVKVFSDKRMTSIRNSVVTFSDGSSVNVKTGDVINKGIGSIRVGGQGLSEDSQPIETVRKEFSAHFLDVSDFHGSVDIQPHDNSSILVEVTGPKSELEHVSMNVMGRVLRISGPPRRSGSGITIVQSGDGQSSSIQAGGNITVTTGDRSFFGRLFSRKSVTVESEPVSDRGLVLKIHVPLGTKVSLTGNSGEQVVGDTQGPLNADIGGLSSLSVGQVSSGIFDIGGSAKVEIDSLTDNTKIDALGLSRVAIKALTANSLTVETCGSSQITIGQAKIGKLLVDSSGLSRVAIENGTVETFKAETAGSGKVLINDGTIGTVTVDSSGLSRVTLNTHVNKAELEVAGSAKIYVLHSNQRPYKEVSGLGKIEVGSYGA